MKLLKKAAAALLAVCTAFGCASCGENTANAMTVDGYDVRAGIYLYYATSAYTEAMSVLRDGGQNFDDVKETKEIKKIMKDATIDEISAEKWIQNKAAEHCLDFVEVSVFDLRACHVLVPAAAEFLHDDLHIQLAYGPGADADHVRR